MKTAQRNIAALRTQRFDLVDRSLSWQHIHQLIDDHNEQYQDPADAKYRIRAGKQQTLIYLLTTYMGQVDSGKAAAGFFETSVSLIATAIHQSKDAVRRHLVFLAEIGWIETPRQAGDATTFGYEHNLKVQFKNTSWERHKAPKEKPKPMPAAA